LSGCQIINYRVNSDEKWMVLIGISAQVWTNLFASPWSLPHKHVPINTNFFHLN
jgi:hypothetical protein